MATLASPWAAALPAGPNPSAQGSLRRALLDRWRDDFPIEPSPFHPLARQLGGSLREVLHHCRQLADEGATTGLCGHWGAPLRRLRVRLLASGARWPLRAGSRLAALPGLTVWNRIESATRLAGTPGEPKPAAMSGWLDLEARSESALRSQLERLRSRTAGTPWRLQRLRGRASTDEDSRSACRCAETEGPCCDPALAALCERGLPLVAHPFGAAASALGRSERAVVARLRRWRADGSLSGLGLAPPPPPPRSAAWFVALAGPPLGDAECTALAERPGVLEVDRTQASGADDAGPWSAWIGLALPASATVEQARQLLGASLAGGRSATLLRVRQERVRAEPRLFADD
jgi:hypothetical protein